MCERMAGPLAPKRLRISELNPHLLCALCGGYLIDATTIIECLHSFCKTCILRYLDTSNYCPICEVLIHKTRPWQNIRLDHSLQNAVYKMVPGLFQDEMKRRREFYEKQSKQDKRGRTTSQPQGELGDRIIFSRDEEFSISIEFSPDGKPVPETRAKSLKRQKSSSLPDKRYLKCPAGLRMEHLKKFIAVKFTLPPTIQIDLFHEKEPLSDTYSLMDVAYIYSWKRDCVLRLFYSFFEIPSKVRKIEVLTKTETEQVVMKSVVKDKKEEKTEKCKDDKKCKSKKEKFKEKKQGRMGGKREVSASDAVPPVTKSHTDDINTTGNEVKTPLGTTTKDKTSNEGHVRPNNSKTPSDGPVRANCDKTISDSTAASGNKEYRLECTSTVSSETDSPMLGIATEKSSEITTEVKSSGSHLKRKYSDGESAPRTKHQKHSNNNFISEIKGQSLPNLPMKIKLSPEHTCYSIVSQINTSDHSKSSKLNPNSKSSLKMLIKSSDFKDSKHCNGEYSASEKKDKKRQNGETSSVSRSNLFERMDSLTKSSPKESKETSHSSHNQKMSKNYIKPKPKDIKCDMKNGNMHDMSKTDTHVKMEKCPSKNVIPKVQTQVPCSHAMEKPTLSDKDQASPKTKSNDSDMKPAILDLTQSVVNKKEDAESCANQSVHMTEKSKHGVSDNTQNITKSEQGILFPKQEAQHSSSNGTHERQNTGLDLPTRHVADSSPVSITTYATSSTTTVVSIKVKPSLSASLPISGAPKRDKELRTTESLTSVSNELSSKDLNPKNVKVDKQTPLPKASISKTEPVNLPGKTEPIASVQQSVQSVSSNTSNNATMIAKVKPSLSEPLKMSTGMPSTASLSTSTPSTLMQTTSIVTTIPTTSYSVTSIATVPSIIASKVVSCSQAVKTVSASTPVSSSLNTVSKTTTATSKAVTSVAVSIASSFARDSTSNLSGKTKDLSSAGSILLSQNKQVTMPAVSSTSKPLISTSCAPSCNASITTASATSSTKDIQTSTSVSKANISPSRIVRVENTFLNTVEKEKLTPKDGDHTSKHEEDITKTTLTKERVKLENFLFDTKPHEKELPSPAVNTAKTKESGAAIRQLQKNSVKLPAESTTCMKDKPSKNPEQQIMAVHHLPKTISQTSKSYSVARSVSVSPSSNSKSSNSIIQTTKISTLIPKSSSISSKGGAYSKTFSYPSTINNVPSSRSFLETSLPPHLPRPDMSTLLNGNVGYDRLMMAKVSSASPQPSLQSSSPASHKSSSSKHNQMESEGKSVKSSKPKTIPPLSIPKSCLSATTLKLQRSPGSTDHYIFAPLSHYTPPSHQNGEKSKSKESKHNGSRTPTSPSTPSKDSVIIGGRQRVPTIKISDINRNPIIVDSGSSNHHHSQYRSFSHGSSRSSSSENGSGRTLSRGSSESSSPTGSAERLPARDTRRPSDSELLLSQRWHGYQAADLLFNGFKIPQAKFHDLHYDTDAMPLDYSQSSSKS